MNEKQFILYEHKDDYYILKNPRIHLDFIEMLGDALTSDEIVEELNRLNDKVVELEEKNKELQQFINKGRRLSVKELMDNANENELLKKENEKLEQKIKDKNKYQRVLEAKIIRLKNRIKILEKAEGWQN